MATSQLVDDFWLVGVCVPRRRIDRKGWDEELKTGSTNCIDRAESKIVSVCIRYIRQRWKMLRRHRFDGAYLDARS